MRLATIVTMTTLLTGPLPAVAQQSHTAAAPVRTLETLSPVYTVDREYRSMKGPKSSQTLRFAEAEHGELVWITGYRAEMVGADGSTPMAQQFMCHSNLDFDSRRHSNLFQLPIYHTNRLFTLSQGQLEIDFPAGFGLPFYSDEELRLDTQVLNLNHSEGDVHHVRHKITVNYVRDRDLDTPMQPLFMTSGWGLVLLEGDAGYFGVKQPHMQDHGEGCLPGETAGRDLYGDEFGREFSGHWVVKPGLEVNRTLVTNIMNLPYDTTAHYVAVHLHPYAESLELIDLTTGQSVFTSDVVPFDDSVGIKRVGYYSSEEGIPLYKDHEYELVSTYDNTSGQDQDSMAVMLMYLLDKKFKPRTDVFPADVAHVPLPPRRSEERVLLHTNLGDITLALYPDAAPGHVEQVLKLVRAGVYDTTSFFRVEPGFLIQTGFPHDGDVPLTPDQQALIRPLRAEFNDLRHRRGALSMALADNSDPDSARTSFSILLGDAPHLDGRYTIFGTVEQGFDTIERVLQVPRDEHDRPTQRIEIKRAQVLPRPLTNKGRSNS